MAPRTSLALLAASCLPWSPSARVADPSCTSDDDISTLQVATRSAAVVEHSVGRDGADAAREAAWAATREQQRVDSDEVHTVFTVDCRPFNLWQSELLFFSAQRIGQRGPITQIASGCDEEKMQHIKERHASLGLPAQYQVYFVQEFNDNRSHCLNKPYGVAAWFREGGAQREVIAVVDPDFLFVRPLTANIEGVPFEKQDWSKTGTPKKVQKGVVVAQRWGLIGLPPSVDHPYHPPFKGETAPGMTEEETLTWICSGSKTGDSGCTGVTAGEIGVYHASGVPYMAHRADWDEWLVDSWKDITERLHTVYKGYYIDMLSWVYANVHRRKREVLMQNFQIYHPSENEWEMIDRSTADPCTSPMDEVLADPTIGHFVHYTHYHGGWNKRWFDHPRSGPHVFERCDVEKDDKWLLKLFNETVDTSTLAQPWTPENKKERRWAWLMCVTRRMFAGAIKRTCAGKPAAELVDKVASGFTF